MKNNEFQAKLEESYEKHKERLRERYKFARSLGFNSRESGKMQGWSEEKIRDFANARKNNQE